MEKYEKLEIEVILLDDSFDIVTISTTETPIRPIPSTPNRSMFSSELDYYAYLEDNDLDDE